MRAMARRLLYCHASHAIQPWSERFVRRLGILDLQVELKRGGDTCSARGSKPVLCGSHWSQRSASHCASPQAASHRRRSRPSTAIQRTGRTTIRTGALDVRPVPTARADGDANASSTTGAERTYATATVSQTNSGGTTTRGIRVFPTTTLAVVARGQVPSPVSAGEPVADSGQAGKFSA